MIRFIKFVNVVLCTGQATARNNFKYQPTVPDIFLPTGTIYLTGQTNKEDGYVSTSSIAINSKGELYTDYPYNDQVFVFTTMYNTI